MIRPKISLFGVGRLGNSSGEKEKERREEEKKKKEEGRREEENPGLELWFRTLVFVSMKPMYGFIG